MTFVRRRARLSRRFPKAGFHFPSCGGAANPIGGVHRLTKVFVDNDEGLRHYKAVKAKRPNPTTAELEILRVLWDRGPMSVREIQRVLNEARPTGYTTVLKTVQIMTGKGLVDRDEEQRPQIYRARNPREHTQRQLLADLAQRAFGGSVKAL